MKRKIVKLILVVAMIVLAGFAAVAVKDFMDRRNPYYAIPQISVTADSEPVSITVADFEWEFQLGGKLTGKSSPVTGLQIKPTNMDGGEQLKIEFSVEPESVTVMRSKPYTYDFSEIGENDLMVPYESGGYIYEISAVFDTGYVTWYCYIIV